MRTAEECKDAVDDLKDNLAAYFEEMGYDDPERMALELLNEYHLQDIDEMMNHALKIARSKRSHSHSRIPIRTHIIGRHVVSLLFGTVPKNAFLRSVFFADIPVVASVA